MSTLFRGVHAAYFFYQALLQICNILSYTCDRRGHGPIIYTDAKPYMSSFLVFNRVYKLGIQSVMLLFSTPLVN